MAKFTAIATLYWQGLRASIILLLVSHVNFAYATDGIQFNTDVLDIKDRESINLSNFGRVGYIMPGSYTMMVSLNQRRISEQLITFMPMAEDPTQTEPCLTENLINIMALKDEFLKKIVWDSTHQCLDRQSLPGLMAIGDLATMSLNISVPQAYLEYSTENWDPPSRWDNGIPGVLFDYNMNFMASDPKNYDKIYNLTGNGTTGANLGAWRLRADWQLQMTHQSNTRNVNDLKWNRYYAYRALPKLGARLSLGENYLSSDIFDNFRFTGISLNTDDNMLPPNLRGYAPEVTGVAKTNAKVIISQGDRVLYETLVAPGPFRIQDLSDAVSGQLDVRVEEQDGSVQQFVMNTANIPYLTRPGSWRYKLALGRPTDSKHSTNGPMFGMGEFSWGVSNGWSLYGGGVVSDDYHSMALGLGRDLMMFGALSFDVTHSRADLEQEPSVLYGNSYRLSYSKRFDDYDSQVTFAGYRFSERDFMNMSEFLDARMSGLRILDNSKQMYTVTLNKQFADLGISAYLNYNRLTYWNDTTNDRYSLSLSSNFDLGTFKNLYLSLTGYRNKYQGVNDDGMYLSLSVPWGANSSLSYDGSWDRNQNTHQVRYYDRFDDNNTYQVSVGSARHGAVASGFYTHQGSMAQMNANVGWQEGVSKSLGLSLQGGATATLEGAALHRSSVTGGTRILLDTDGVANVPVHGFSQNTYSNYFGKAVVADVSNYYRNQISIDLNKLDDNTEVIGSVQEATLTEGAIGFRRFEVISGEKAMAVIKLADGSSPPFGATVKDNKNRGVGIVSDDGSVYLSGIQPGATMTVHWDGKARCEIQLPAKITENSTVDLQLSCRSVDIVDSQKTEVAEIDIPEIDIPEVKIAETRIAKTKVAETKMVVGPDTDLIATLSIEPTPFWRSDKE